MDGFGASAHSIWSPRGSQYLLNPLTRSGWPFKSVVICSFRCAIGPKLTSAKD